MLPVRSGVGTIGTGIITGREASAQYDSAFFVLRLGSCLGYPSRRPHLLVPPAGGRDDPGRDYNRETPGLPILGLLPFNVPPSQP